MGCDAEYGMSKLLREVAEKDARITELTTKVADLKAKLDFANAMNADQDKTVAELTAEMVSIRSALRECEVVLDGMTAHSWDSGSPFDFRVKEAHRIARNALKERV